MKFQKRETFSPIYEISLTLYCLLFYFPFAISSVYAVYWSSMLTYPWVDLPIPALAFIVIYFKLQYAQNREREKKIKKNIKV